MRVILTELNRIASHQLWLGTHALDIGAITPLFYTFRDREEILKIYEKYCGARLTTHAFRIGGLQYETYTGFEKEVTNFLTFFRPKIDEYEELLTGNRIWIGRTKGVGYISLEDMLDLSVTGPMLWPLALASGAAARALTTGANMCSSLTWSDFAKLSRKRMVRVLGAFQARLAYPHRLFWKSLTHAASVVWESPNML